MITEVSKNIAGAKEPVVIQEATSLPKPSRYFYLDSQGRIRTARDVMAEIYATVKPDPSDATVTYLSEMEPVFDLAVKEATEADDTHGQ